MSTTATITTAITVARAVTFTTAATITTATTDHSTNRTSVNDSASNILNIILHLGIVILFTAVIILIRSILLPAHQYFFIIFTATTIFTTIAIINII